MADLSSQQIFANGDLVTAETLNNIMSTSSVLPDVISSKSEKSAVVGGDDYTLLFDTSSATLKKARVNSIRNATGDTTLPSSLIVKNGTGGASTFSVASSTGNTAIAGTLGVAGNTTMVGTLNVSSLVTLAVPPIVSAALPSLPVFTDANKALTSVAITGAGNVVMSAGPTITGTATIAKTAIGGATIGTNSLAVTGTSSLADTTIAGTATATKVAVGGATVGTNALAVTGKSSLSDVDSLALTATSLAVSGNVGVGTTTPAAVRLEVKGVGSTASNPSTSSSLSATLALTDTAGASGNGGMVMFGASQGFWAAIKGGITNGNTNTTGDLLFCTRRAVTDTTLTESMRITGAGEVGIGTIDPVGKFDVVGGRSHFAAASEQYSVGAKFVSTGGSVYFGASSGSATPDAVISTSGGSALMTLQNGGNVGIGITTPSTKLHVAGVITHSAGTIGSNANGTRTVTTTTTTPVGGADGDIVFVI